MTETELLDLFTELVPAPVWEELSKAADEKKKRPSPQIYTLPVVVWLMVYQRLNAHGTQQEAVRALQKGEPAALLESCKRLREARISGATGGYAQACGRVSTSEMVQVTDLILQSIAEPGARPTRPQRRAYLIDGTTVSAEHEPDLLKYFPAAKNQHGTGHWGVVQIVMLHNLATGTPLRPCWGAMYGEKATSEQKLAEAAMGQLSAGDVLIGDPNFGVFSVVWGAQKRDLRVVFRLTQARAKALLGTNKLAEVDQQIDWHPSRWDRQHHPEIPPEAHVAGRLIVRCLAGFREPLCLFTTLEDPAEEIVALYLQRWNFETDLRSLKTTLRLQHLRAKSPAAAEKEFLAAVIAYALVRAFMTVAAERIDLAPRRLSFTGAWVVLNSGVGDLCCGLEQERHRAMDLLLRDIGQKKLPQRSHRRSYPRAIWGHRQNFRRRTPDEN